MEQYSSKSILWSYSNADRSNLVSVHHQECDNFKRWKKNNSKYKTLWQRVWSVYKQSMHDPAYLKKKLSFFLHVSMSTYVLARLHEYMTVYPDQPKNMQPCEITVY